MQARGDRRENEIKLRMPDAASARRLLEQAGLHLSVPRVFEDNLIFDTPDAKLRREGSLLRIRHVGGAGILTYKGPAGPGRYKNREELEVEVSDRATLRLILERIGFQPAFRYQKFRTEFSGGSASGIATIDETPIGVFVELEGAPEWIDETALKMGRSDRDYITASYARLYDEYCRERSLPPSDMVFPELR